MHASPAVHSSPRSSFRRPLQSAASRVPSREVPPPRTNRVLASLPADVCHRLDAELNPVTLSARDVLFEAGCKRDYVYFPTSAIASLLCDTADGASCEIATVGNEGVLGFSLVTGGETMCSRAVVVSAGHAYRLSSALLRREIDRRGALMESLLRYTQVLLSQIGQTAACNRHHSVDQQLCRRLLSSVDRLSTDELTMTHEHIAHTLGVRRESITEAALRLQAGGVIRYSRGVIKILDRDGLETRACECYRMVKHESDRLMTGGLRPDAGTSRLRPERRC